MPSPTFTHSSEMVMAFASPRSGEHRAAAIAIAQDSG
jgi:hypothetical protein